MQNLLDDQYSTVWGQRAAMFYSPYYGPEYLYDYQGRGRTTPKLVDGLLSAGWLLADNSSRVR
ncbi:hypothetical protein HSBAA_63240 [Vreelandella sulfidaeris]|uniref:Uncharacterized protein n=1 Tax=Vreelandella sulfidaeris TaxID=115553 RepID=A0A455UKZ3_9GAMM|nr:hypothetical protein HSBAA_63240 [Halomonas sulfidaeris]